MNKTLTITLGGLAFLAAHLLLLPADIYGALINVNCPGDSLQTKINGAQSGDDLLITGLCPEKEVTVPGNLADLTLLGEVPPVAGTGIDSSGGSPRRSLIIHGTNITVQGLTITGGRGITVELGGSAFILDNDIVDGRNNGIGIQVETNGHATILGNKITGYGRGGILVASSASAFVGVDGGGPQDPISVQRNLIQDNGIGVNNTATGVKVRRTARGRVSGNCIRNNSQSGITVDQGASVHASSNTIDSNLVGGISVSQNSVLTLRQDSAGGIHNAPNATTGFGENPAVCAGFPAPAGPPASVNNGGVGLECNSNSYIGGVTGSVKGTSPGRSSVNDVKVANTCVNELF